MLQPLPHDNFPVKRLPIGHSSDGCRRRTEIQTHPLRDTLTISNVHSQSFDADPLPIKFRLVCVGKTSRRDYLPLRKSFALNEVGSWQDVAAAADALESAQGLPEEIVGDWNVAERLIGTGKHWRLVSTLFSPTLSRSSTNSSKSGPWSPWMYGFRSW